MVASRGARRFYDNALLISAGSSGGGAEPGALPEQGQKGLMAPRRGQGAPLHRAPCKATWMLQGCEGSEFTPRGSLGSTGFTALTGSSRALGAVSPEGEACFILDCTALPLGPGTSTAPLAPKPCKCTLVQGGVSHLHTEQFKQGTPQLPQAHSPPQKSVTWKTEALLWCQCSRGHQRGLREETSPH